MNTIPKIRSPRLAGSASALEVARSAPPGSRGSLHLEWRRCGDSTCHCARGRQHGPYFVRRWREGGRQRKELVRPEELGEVMSAIEERRSLAPVSRIRRSLQALKAGAGF